MTREETYEFIGKLALALHSQGLQIKLSSLHTILDEKGVSVAEGHGKERGVRRARVCSLPALGANRT